MAMSLPRRLALLVWAERHDAAIVEDDYDSEFRYAGRPIEPLQTLDGSGRVIYVGSFSKTLLATLRQQLIVESLDDRFADHLKPVHRLQVVGLHVAAAAPTTTPETLRAVRAGPRRPAWSCSPCRCSTAARPASPASSSAMGPSPAPTSRRA
jgi:CubicO group peptidase (beta-lactamase class C family)